MIATGITTRVRDFVKMAFAQAGVTVAFEGKGENEKGIVTQVAIPDIRLSVFNTVRILLLGALERQPASMTATAALHFNDCSDCLA